MKNEIINKYKLEDSKHTLGASFANNIIIYLSRKYELYFAKCDKQGFPTKDTILIFGKGCDITATEELLLDADSDLLMQNIKNINL